MPQFRGHCGLPLAQFIGFSLFRRLSESARPSRITVSRGQLCTCDPPYVGGRPRPPPAVCEQLYFCFAHDVLLLPPLPFGALPVRFQIPLFASAFQGDGPVSSAETRLFFALFFSFAFFFLLCFSLRFSCFPFHCFCIHVRADDLSPLPYRSLFPRPRRGSRLPPLPFFSSPSLSLILPSAILWCSASFETRFVPVRNAPGCPLPSRLF